MSLNHVDFARPILRFRAGWATLILGLGALAAAAAAAYELSRQQKLVSAAQSLQAQKSQATRPTQQSKILSVEEIHSRKLQNALVHDWTNALEALEDAATSPVFTLSVSLDTATRSMRVDAEAPTVRHAIGFVEAIQACQGISAATLVGHQEWTESVSQRHALRFAAVATWGKP